MDARASFFWPSFLLSVDTFLASFTPAASLPRTTETIKRFRFRSLLEAFQRKQLVALVFGGE